MPVKEMGKGYAIVEAKIGNAHMHPFDHGIITAKGKSIKIGKTMCLAEATAVDQNDKWLAHGTSKMTVTKGLQTIEDALKFSGTEAHPTKFI